MNGRHVNKTNEAIMSGYTMAATLKIALLLGPVVMGEAGLPALEQANAFDQNIGKGRPTLAGQGLFHQPKHIKRDPHHTLPGRQGKRSSR